jgi:hypothetical protein
MEVFRNDTGEESCIGSEATGGFPRAEKSPSNALSGNCGDAFSDNCGDACGGGNGAAFPE